MQGVIAHGVVVIGCARRDARQALKKIHDRHAEKLGEALKAAGRDAVDAQFVIRDLLHDQADDFGRARPA